MTFRDIEQRRKLAGISQYALCREAGVHGSTYFRRVRDGDEDRSRSRTVQKLAAALDRLIARKVEQISCPADAGAPA